MCSTVRRNTLGTAWSELAERREKNWLYGQAGLCNSAS